MLEWLKSIGEKHRYMILGLLIGLLCAILFISIGFWRTLLLALLIALGVSIGIKLDRGNSFSEIILGWSQFWKRLARVIGSWFR